MKFILKSLFITTLLCFVLLSVLVVSLLDGSPQVIEQQPLDASAAQNSKMLAKRLYGTIKRQSKMNFVRINQTEINSLTALLHRAVPQVKMQVTLSDVDAMIYATAELPLPGPFKYLNIQTRLLPSYEGLWFDETRVGAVTFNGDRMLRLLIAIVDYKLSGDAASKAFAMIRSVNINKDRLFVRAELDDNLLEQNNEQSIFTKLRDELALLGDVNNIKFYHQALVEFSRNELTLNNKNLAIYVNHVFTLAKNKALVVEDEDAYSAVNENQAALIALVLYFGSDRFKLLVGEFQPLSANDLLRQKHLRTIVKLQNRVDLQKHFIYSAALQLFSTQYASDALGEFKELLDSNRGGSGFSFADLQADRAGTRLAMIVTESEQSALVAQALLSTIKDGELLPSIEGLAEGISEARFVKQYTNVSSDEYQQTITTIDQRLKTSPLYQLGW